MMSMRLVERSIQPTIVTVRPTASSNSRRISPTWGRLPDPWRPRHGFVSSPRLLVGRARSVSPLWDDSGRVLPRPASLDQFLPAVALPPSPHYAGCRSTSTGYLHLQ